MKVIICGAGQVGFGIAERLSAQKHDVTVIDSSSDLIANISNNLDVRGIVGSGSFPDVLMQGGASEADIILAVTQADEVNMIICQVAHTLFNIPTKIARIRSSNYLQAEYSEIFSTDNIPIDVIISPEIEIGESILRNLMLPGAFEIIQFGNLKFKVQFPALSPITAEYLSNDVLLTQTLTVYFLSAPAVLLGPFK